MGNYNADAAPDVAKIRRVAYGYKFFTTENTKVDQFATSGANKVYHLVRKIGSSRLQILVDPSSITD